VGSSIDLFHDKTIQYLPRTIDYATHRPDITFQFLTKCPENLPREWPDNCWVGCSVTNDKLLDVAVDKLEDITAKVKFISFEPLLEHLTLSLDYAMYYSGINWLIIGPMTGNKRDIMDASKQYPKHTPMEIKKGRWGLMPPIEWVREIVEAADKAGVKVFLKNHLKPLILKEAAAETIFWSKLGGLRQEYPLEAQHDG